MLNLEKQISSLENRLANKNDIPTATMLALRYWQASRFSPSEAAANTLIQRANHTVLTTHRRNASHVDMYALAIFITIEAGHYDSAAEMLDKAMGYKSFLRTNAPYQYAQMCFLRTYLAIKQGQARYIKKYWRTLADHIQTAAPSVDYTIMQGLLHLAAGEYDEAFNHLRDAFRKGSNSIFLYEGLYRYYRTTPHKPKSGTILAVLIYVAERGVDIADTALRHQDALLSATLSNPEAGEHLYKLSGYLPLLQGICAHRIANNDVSAAAYSYYKKAEHKQIFVDGLYHALVYAAYANNASHISRHALAQFLKTEKMERGLAVYVYHLLITTPDMEDLLLAQHARIVQTTEDCIKAGVSGREANSLYHYYWLKCKASTSMNEVEEILSRNLTMFEIITAQKSAVRHIYITQPEQRDMEAYNLQDKKAALPLSTSQTDYNFLEENQNSLTIEASSSHFSYTCLGAGRRVILDEKLIVKRMIPCVGAELYQHFFDKGDRRFHLLVYLTNHYLNLQNPSDAAIPVLEAVLAEKTIAKTYRMRILVVLGRLYYNASHFAKALECYNEVDQNALDENLTEQTLSIYLQTNEAERAVQLITIKHSNISSEILQNAICTLLSMPIGHAPLAEAAYGLLMNGFYKAQLLDLVLAHFNASYNEWVALAQALCENDVTSISLDKLILETALWMAQWDTDAQKAFVRVCNLGDKTTDEIIVQFIEYATYELFANAARPEYDTLDILEACCLQEPENTLLTWGLASCYLHHNITTVKSEAILSLAIETLESKGILFPIFKESRFARVPYIEKNQPFLHRGLPGKDYRFNYRIDDAPGFIAIPMQYVKYGMYVACIPLFYNEEITYYFSEELATGSVGTKASTVKNTTPFLYNHPSDQFFTINNAIIYEQMFKHDQVEKALGKLVKDVQAVRSKLL